MYMSLVRLKALPSTRRLNPIVCVKCETLSPFRHRSPSNLPRLENDGICLGGTLKPQIFTLGVEKAQAKPYRPSVGLKYLEKNDPSKPELSFETGLLDQARNVLSRTRVLIKRQYTRT